jgi:CBS domain-containing protein
VPQPPEDKMSSTAHRLDQIRARDIMRRDVVRLDPTISIEEAAATLADAHIGGAPVVDRSGRLIGILSAADIAKPDGLQEGDRPRRAGSYELAQASPDDDGSYDEDVVFTMEDYSPEALRAGVVADFMTSEVICVRPNAALREIAALMVREHIHRVPVIEGDEIVGIISSLDIARCVAEAV